MKITFVYPGAESLAIEYLSSSLKEKGHSTALVFDPALFDDKQYLNIPFLARIFDSRKRVIERIIASSPDLLAFSAGTDIYLWACGIAAQIKKRCPQLPVIFGGVHPSAVPELVIKNDFVDMVCIGEAEEALCELAGVLASGKMDYGLKNIWFKKDGRIIKNPVRNLTQDLDNLPLPDKGLFEEDILIRGGKYMIMTSRGCPFKCTYCYNDVLKELYADKGKFVRQRSVDNVLNELKIMKERYNYGSVAFMDDLFVGNRPWFKEFIPGYKKEIGVPYSCMTSTNVIDEEMVGLLKDSGCTRLQFGIQTMDEKTRSDILGRNFETTDHIKRAIAACDKAGISYSLDHIFGIPFEGEEEYKKTAEFFVQTKTDRICCYALFYYPKTNIIQSAKKAGLLDDKDIRNIEEGRAKLYVYGSSLKGRQLRVFYSLRKLYSFAPLLPKKFNLFLLNSGFYKCLRFVPRIFTLFCEVISAVKTRHPRANDYLRYYLFHIRRRALSYRKVSFSKMNKIVVLDKNTFFFIGRVIKWHISRYFFGRGFPLIATFQLTNRCNFNCRMCNIKNNPRQDTLALAAFKKIIDELSSMGTIYVTLSGGEPLLIKDIFDYVSYAKSKICFVNLVTNGYLLSEEFAKRLGEIKLNSIAISLDALGGDNDLLRGIPGAFDKALEAIGLLKKYAPGVKITVNTVISSQNLPQIPRLADLTQELGVAHKFQPVYRHPDFGAGPIDYAPLLITKGDMQRLYSAIAYLKQKENVVNSSYFLSSIPEYFSSDYRKEIFNQNCIYPSFCCEFREDGKMYPCIAGKLWKNGYDVRGGIRDVFYGRPYAEEIKKLKHCRRCRDFFSVCYVESRLSLPLANFIKFNLIKQ